VVVHRLDRLARSLIGYVLLLEEFQKHRVSLFIVTAPELGSTAHDNLIFNILASFCRVRTGDDRVQNSRRSIAAEGQGSPRCRRGSLRLRR